MWLEDRNFRTREFACEIDEGGAFFVIRQHQKLAIEVLSALRPAGRIETPGKWPNSGSGD